MDYRGELGVILINQSLHPVWVKDSERIAQLVLNKIEKLDWVQVSELDKTNRGEGGFGHTNK